jgi:1-acyl-sn-glycerol-3-phosphate acyltransferase
MSRSLYSSRLTNWILKPINDTIANSGFQSGFKSILTKTNTKQKIKGLTPALKEILKNKPYLSIANHPAEAEVLSLLASLPTRPDFRLIAGDSFENILPAFNKHLILVYIHDRVGNDWKHKILKKIHYSPSIKGDIAHQKNVNSINTASEIINQGGAVNIFPLVGGNSGPFFSGVGYLANGLKKPATANMIFIHLTGSSDFDYLRILPFIGRLLPPFEVHFYTPGKISQFIGADGKQTAKNLEVAYYAWVESIRSRFYRPSIAFKTLNRSYLYLRTFLVWLLSNR